MKSYILVHHATGKEIEVKAEEMTAYPDFYQLMISEKIVGRFSTEQFSVYIRLEEVEKESTVRFTISGDDIVGVMGRQKKAKSSDLNKEDFINK